MRILVLGNPKTEVSSEKFLRMLLPILLEKFTAVGLLNDGKGLVDHPRLESFSWTLSAQCDSAASRNRVGKVAAFIILQFALSLTLLRRIHKFDVAFVLPILMPLPVAICKLFRRNVVVYLAQDVLGDSSKRPNAGSSMFNIAANLLRLFVLTLASHIIVEGPGVIEQNRASSYSAKAILWHQYIDPQRYFLAVKPTEREAIVGFVGSFEPRKGALEFAEAVQRLVKDHNEWRYVFVGRGTLEDQVRSVARSAIQDHVVDLVGHVPEAEFPRLLNRLKLCVVPSLSEGLPNIVLEAMACGAVVLASNVGAVPSVVTDGWTGFLMRDNRPDTIARNIVRALQHPDLERIAVRASQFIISEYSRERSLELMDRLRSKLTR